ncbi:hypothetical protein [Wolbachia endosymbiont of Psylliodes chrysocephala]|uniref:hypothetical protein n=1 Tax=Wolbachia endosymbiont of Psylliodes chrysocephala TaxID=2883236 RepID=UPI00209CCF65|nr:hypothetical protein [Wolbachia endosymbiont of Psylliodes chrysocephala]
MRTPKKIWKSIAKKFKNSAAAKEQEPSVSSSTEKRRRQKILEDIPSIKTTIEQQTTPTTKTTTAKDENSKEVREVCKYGVTNKDTTHIIDKATETDTKLCNKNSETGQPIFESSEKAQNDSVETTVEPTSVDRETNEQEPNAPDSPSSAELCFDGDAADKNLSAKALQQRQAIIFGSVGAALLVSSIVACILKMYAIAVIVGIVGLACIGFALYNIINPNTKLEKVEDIEQPIVESSLNPT